MQGLADHYSKMFAEYEFNHAGDSHADAWTLKFLDNTYRNALIELIDTDCSGFVSVQEVNQFTQSKPKECRYS